MARAMKEVTANPAWTMTSAPRTLVLAQEDAEPNLAETIPAYSGGTLTLTYLRSVATQQSTP